MPYGQINTDTIQSSTTGTAPVFKDGSGSQIGTLCRAWVNFAGASGTRNASFNVSSVTRNSTGNYTVNFATAFADANYAVSSAFLWNGAGNGNTQIYTSPTASSVVVQALTTAGAFYDPTSYTVAIFR